MPRAATTTGRMAAITAIVGADLVPRPRALKVCPQCQDLEVPSLTAQQLGPPAQLQSDEVIRAMDRTWIETVTASDASEAEPSCTANRICRFCGALCQRLSRKRSERSSDAKWSAGLSNALSFTKANAG